MRLLKSIFLLFVISFTSLVNATQDFTLKLKIGDHSLTELPSNMLLTEAISNNHLDHYSIIQFVEIPTNSEKSALLAEGIDLLEYIPNHAFIARVDIQSGSKTLSDFGIRSITPYKVEYKFAPRLAIRDTPEWANYEGNKVDLTIDLQLDVKFSNFQEKLENLGVEILQVAKSEEYLNIRLNNSLVDDLSELSQVKFLDYVPAPPEKEDDRGRSLHRGNLLDSDHPLGRKYDGSGVSIAIADDGIIGPHIDFKGRVTQFTNTDNGTHGDMTSGIAIGGGNLDPTIRGMAPGAYLYYYDIGGYPHISNAVSNLNTRGVVVTSTSYSQGCNDYESTARGIDQQVRLNPELLHVFSAGNSSSANCGYGAGTPWGTITGGRKQGKAVIATGNLDYRGFLTASSSRGPSADGRIKPDICANGTNQMSTDPNNSYSPGGGTSAAAPGIAGLAAQLYHGYRDLNNGNNPESGLIKASMLNTARDIGNPGPDFFYGWGRVNAHRAMKLLEENRYLNGSLSQNGSNTHSISIGANLEQLRVMVYWTDYEGSTVASKALVNDLDMRLVTPNGDTIRPWTLNPAPNSSTLSNDAVRGNDDLNNVEQVTIDTVPTGSYTVLVNGTAIPQGPQSYHVLWETISDSIEVTYPSGGESFEPNTVETIRWDAHGNFGTFNLEYSSDSGATWSSLGTINGSTRYRNWSVPAVVTGDLLIRISRSGSTTGISKHPASIIGVPQNLAPVYTCPDSVRITWDTVSGATAYEISLLGAKYMDSIGTTTTNTFDIYNLTLSNDNWFSVKALGNGIKGRRAIATKLFQTATNCPIDYDMNVTQISSPSNSYIPICNVSKLGIQVTINNAGDSTLSNIPMRLEAGGIVYYDTIVGPLNPGAFQFFTFSDSIPLGIPGAMPISVIADLGNDANPLNDSISTTVNIVGNSSVQTIPYSNDFENFNACATTNNCGVTNCNLNGGWVNLTNGTDDDFDMRVDFGGTPSNGTGPSFDHNPGTANGQYIYSEASNGCYGVESHILSPCFDLSTATSPEFSFWYHMDGSDMGILRVDVMSHGNWDNNVITPLFGDNGNVWLEEKVDLSQYVGEKITIRFRVTTGSSWQSDLAIDDISLTDLSTDIVNVKDQGYQLYPNPSKGIFNIRFEENMNSTIQVIDLSGRIIKEERLNSDFTTVDLSAYDKGIYFLKIVDANIMEKVILH